MLERIKVEKRSPPWAVGPRSLRSLSATAPGPTAQGGELEILRSRISFSTLMRPSRAPEARYAALLGTSLTVGRASWRSHKARSRPFPCPRQMKSTRPKFAFAAYRRTYVVKARGRACSAPLRPFG